MKYFKQVKGYTCGCACFRMAMNEFNLPDISEEELEYLMKSLPESGTHYDSMVNIAKNYGLQCQSGQNGTLEYLDSLLSDGWVVVLAYSVDVPHYAIYLGNNGNHLFLKDPYFGEKQPHLISKFVRSQWLVDVSLYKVAIAEMYLELPPSLNTNKWWVAYKK